MQVWTPYSPVQGETLDYKNTQKGEVSFLWEPLQLMSTPGAARGQAWVIIMPVVVVVVRADEVAMRGLLVVSDQVFVREPLGGQTQWTCYRSEGTAWPWAETEAARRAGLCC